MRVNKFFSSAGLILLAALVLVSTLVVEGIFKGARLDLTESNIYTLSDGSKKIVAELPSQVELFFYFSHDATRDALAWRNYARQVQEMLEEFEMASNGNIKLHVIEPEPFSEEEDQAAEYGLEALNVTQGGDAVYFGLAAVRMDADAGKEGEQKEKTAARTEVIAFFQPDRQGMVEYDIAKLIYQVGRPSKPKVAVISDLEVAGGWDMMTRQPNEAWTAYQQVQQLFDVTTLDNEVEHISKDEYSLLVLIHPKTLPDTLLYAIDQYVLQGGLVLAFIDPFAEQDRDMFGGEGSSKASELSKLLTAWGIKFDTTKIVGDFKLAVPVNVTRDSAPVKHVGILQMSEANHASENMIVKQLESINMSTAGFLQQAEGAKTTLEPILVSTDAAMPIDAEKLNGLTDPAVLMRGFKPTGEKYVLAGLVKGDASSAFPAGAPVKETKDEKEADPATQAAKPAEPEKPAKPAHDHIKEGKISVMLVADTDILSDRLWVQVQQFFGQKIAQPFADNGAFFVNSIDVLAGSPDLISVRSRGRFVRPFTVLQDMQRDAEANFRQIEEDLKSRLEATEAKLNELQNKRDDKGAVLTLTPEQQETLLSFQEEKLSIRKQLRDVQHQLNKDIEALEMRVKIINIVAVPLVMTLLVIIMALVRRRRPAAA
jgi:ABC-type uncharacterized transport system involved in gliding motility auxiliary subunit